MLTELLFKLWLESEEEELSYRANQQQPKHLGDFIHQQQGIWMIPFRNIQHDPQEGWFVYWDYEHVSDLDKMRPGDRVGDYNLNTAISGGDRHVMWTISRVDDDRGRIYLSPTENNPFISGVGAGGRQFTQHDYDVHSGKYEDERVSGILQHWKAGRTHDISDIAYLLLGTVPVQVGPNGSQGGWYNVIDTRSNRGGRQGMDASEIMVRDAHTIQNQFKMSVPKGALTGELDPRKWNDFMKGQGEEGTEIEGEDWTDPDKMYKMALTHKQPQIKRRNVEALIDQYKGYSEYRKQRRANLDNEEELDKIDEKWKSGEFRNEHLAAKLRQLAKELLNIHVKNHHEYEDFDHYWNAKEKLIHIARQENWKDILELYENAKDADNRRAVFYAYEEGNDPTSMIRMLNKEKNVENVGKFIYGLTQVDPAAVIKYIEENENSLRKMVQKTGDAVKDYHAEELRKTIGMSGTRASIRSSPEDMSPDEKSKRHNDHQNLFLRIIS